MARERKFSTDDLFQATRALLLRHDYEGFTISLLADQLEVSRGALYKYFVNREELISEFMVYEMNQFLVELKKIEIHKGFEAQFDFLIDLFFGKPDTLRLIKIGRQIPTHTNQKVQNNKKQLDQLHISMYSYLENFIQLGLKEGKLNPNIPNSLMLSYIFQSVTIPNHFETPYSVWVSSIKEMLRNGMFIKS
ncbi:TetR/AcrR family transcriptional regulator [Bacillus fonticola]|uniref:TetR/AcrR family transcriptional regulator n=1 Tax=Bacillus fonticola TaxID=2728853 RepID=UPI0014734920|nr:TetR/AcrR family transcriptional regulator [Bacillus fonticola]